jgi:hypothetical protein
MEEKKEWLDDLGVTNMDYIGEDGNVKRVKDPAKEEWRPCLSVPEVEVSSFGRVREAKSGAVIVMQKDKDGYVLMEMGDEKGEFVHRLVAEAFLPIGDNDFMVQVNHINWKRDDNHVYNLELVTPKENHAWKNHPKKKKGYEVPSKKGRFNPWQKRRLGAQAKKMGKSVAELEAECRILYDRPLI